MKRPPDVALLVETSNGYARALLHGICGYMRKFGPWSVHFAEQSRGADPPRWLRRWKGDGVIARVEHERIAAAITALGLPAVNVSGARLLPHLPCVETDDAAIARLAVEHFRERGFRHFGFCSVADFSWSQWRCEHFTRLVAEAGFSCSVYQPPHSSLPNAWDQDRKHLARWVRQLPQPVGVLAAWDGCGIQLIDVCRQLGVAVPDQVAVLGVDDDELLCDLGDPTLSSINVDSYRIGYEAAMLLDRLMAGQQVPGAMHLVPPAGLVTRKSTDVLAVEDREIAQALHFIRKHACSGINVEDVLGSVTLSRRVLEERFKKGVGRTPHEEIVRVQLQRVQELLAETDLPLSAIAVRAGFRHVEYLSVVFKKKLGQPPSAYRAQHQR